MAEQPYVTISDLKSALGITTTGDDVELDRAVEAASRAVDNICGRVFYDVAASTSARVFDADTRYRVAVDDFHTTSGLAVAVDSTDDGTFDQTWTSSEYDPRRPSQVHAGWPYTSLVAVGDYLFPAPSRRRRVQVTARWGWAAIPYPIEQATQFLATKLFRRKDTPEGVVATTEFAAVRVAREDPDVMSLLKPYMRHALLIA